MPIPQEFIDSVAGANVKTIAEAPAVLTNVMLSNAVSQAASQFQLTQSLTAKAAELLITTDISEAGALSSLLQQVVKAAQSTPPVTP